MKTEVLKDRIEKNAKRIIVFCTETLNLSNHQCLIFRFEVRAFCKKTTLRALTLSLSTSGWDQCVSSLVSADDLHAHPVSPKICMRIFLPRKTFGMGKIWPVFLAIQKAFWRLFGPYNFIMGQILMHFYELIFNRIQKISNKSALQPFLLTFLLASPTETYMLDNFLGPCVPPSHKNGNRKRSTKTLVGM